MPGELLSRLTTAAATRMPVTVIRDDGTRAAGTVVAVAITYCVVRGPDAVDRRVELRDVAEILRRDGRRFYPPREARP